MLTNKMFYANFKFLMCIYVRTFGKKIMISNADLLKLTCKIAYAVQ